MVCLRSKYNAMGNWVQFMLVIDFLWKIHVDVDVTSVNRKNIFQAVLERMDGMRMERSAKSMMVSWNGMIVTSSMVMVV